MSGCDDMEKEGTRNNPINLNSIINLSDNRVTVLCHLALNGPANIYQIAQRTGLRYSAAHLSIKYLEDNDLVELEKEVDTEKGATAKVYGLTLPGLAAVIESGRLQEEKDFNTLAEKWGKLLPPILGKWKYFGKKFSLEERKELLEYIAESIQHDFGFWVKAKSYNRWEPALGHFVYYICRHGNFLKWLKTLREDQELRQWVTDELATELDYRRFLVLEYAKIFYFMKNDELDWEEVEKKFSHKSEISLDKVFSEIDSSNYRKIGPPYYPHIMIPKKYPRFTFNFPPKEQDKP